MSGYIELGDRDVESVDEVEAGILLDSGALASRVLSLESELCASSDYVCTPDNPSIRSLYTLEVSPRELGLSILSKASTTQGSIEVVPADLTIRIRNPVRSEKASVLLDAELARLRVKIRTDSAARHPLETVREYFQEHLLYLCEQTIKERVNLDFELTSAVCNCVGFEPPIEDLLDTAHRSTQQDGSNVYYLRRPVAQQHAYCLTLFNTLSKVCDEIGILLSFQEINIKELREDITSACTALIYRKLGGLIEIK